MFSTEEYTKMQNNKIVNVPNFNLSSPLSVRDMCVVSSDMKVVASTIPMNKPITIFRHFSVPALIEYLTKPDEYDEGGFIVVKRLNELLMEMVDIHRSDKQDKFLEISNAVNTVLDEFEHTDETKHIFMNHLFLLLNECFRHVSNYDRNKIDDVYISVKANSCDVMVQVTVRF